MKKLYFFIAAILTMQYASAQLFVNNLNHTPQELVEAIFNGDNVDITNVTFSGDSTQFSFFQNNNSVIPIDSGLVMVTGSAQSIVGEFGGFLTNTIVNDPDLMTISGQNINDAAIVEFDITVYADTLSFFYSFASDEYASFTCSQFNDPFALLISGPGISGPFSNNSINLAIIPESQIPVSINTLNSGQSSNPGNASICEDANPNWIDDSIYFIPNNPPQDNFVMNGLTVTLEAKTTVTFGETYHIKLAIGDALDGAFDSAVFLEAKAELGPCLDWGSLSGKVFEDANNNDTAETNELRFADKLIQGQSAGSYAFTNENGHYSLCEPLLQGDISLVEVPNYYSIVTNPVPFQFDAAGGSETANFILNSLGSFSDLTVHSVHATSSPAPGFEHRIYYNFKNEGTVCITDSDIDISVDTNLAYIGSDLVGIVENTNSLSYNLDEICPQENFTFYVDYLVNQTAILDSSIVTNVSISFDGSDETPLNNSFVYTEIIIGSFDPNDKQVSDAFIVPQFITESKKLDYTIRFMNTGTAEAHNVKIEDVLPIDQLDMSTMQFVATSHQGYDLEFNTDTLTVLFENIMLPDSGADFLGSQGFISFRIAPYSNMQVNESILNEAAIFFDFNEPIITNMVSTTLIVPTAIEDHAKTRFTIYPNPNNTGVVNIIAENHFTELRFYNMLGALVKSQRVSGNRVNADVSNLDTGVYFIQLIGDDENSLGVQKFVKY
ncbi:T9SS type A sorting domain-containing protein [Cryomorpha ignava]|uniref:T9SS type A sorting domain-containing protein n=1 Tax=Cryomorpha ignava TaxID=101383 RepID=A0A7K3WV15_9FLAO|nr:choice-of-anchor L domain-containing protein [Cryomorpha ignava]NEN24515.1 T9SS type A sorting domain-containing protein [Cryomorpha ignava]